MKNSLILVIEDDPFMLQIVSQLLKDEGYEVLGAENGAVALELLEKSPVPDLILLDLGMPVMNGQEFAREYKRRFDLRAPIIIISGGIDADLIAKKIEAVGWLEKPYALDKVVSLVKTWTNRIPFSQ